MNDTLTDEESIVQSEIQDHPDIEALDCIEDITEPVKKRMKPNTEPSPIHGFQLNLPNTPEKEDLATSTPSPQSKQKYSNMPFFETLAPAMDSLPLSAQLKLRAKFMNLLAEEVYKMENSKSE